MKLTKYRVEIENVNRVNPVLVSESEHEFTDRIDTPERIAEACNHFVGLNKLVEEHVLLMVFGAVGPIALFEVAHGQVSSCLVSTADIVKRMLLCGIAVGGVVLHNHPSKRCNYSAEDLRFCRKIDDAFVLLGFELMDFIIVSGDTYFSFAEHNLLKE